ncbi:MAG TPA: hypothetical protein VF088_19140 [Pyrinomonadaceae bacterium]
MPDIKKQSHLSVKASAARKAGAKAVGTRNGTLDDWREASEKYGKTRNQRHTLRDGR